MLHYTYLKHAFTCLNVSLYKFWLRNSFFLCREIENIPFPHTFSLLFVRPFPLPSLPFDKHAWIFDLPAKKKTVLQSSIS